MTNYPSKQQIPLQVRLLGSNTILNDASTSNSLSLKVINSPLSNNTRPILRLDSTSKFIISFEKGNNPEALMATDDELKDLEISASPAGWTPKHTANSTEWEFTATNINQLAEGEGITLSITELVTSSASDLGYLYIDYQNIGSYPDGRLVVPIEKTPLLYKEQKVGIGTTNPAAKLHVYDGNAVISGTGKVGIGTTNPAAKLHVDGSIRLSGNIEGGSDRIFGIYPNTSAHNSRAWIEMWDNSDNSITGELTLAGTSVDLRYNSTADNVGSTGIRLTSDGKVGIGTTSPSAKLHVNGGDAVISGKVAISGVSTTENTHQLTIQSADEKTLRLIGSKSYGSGARLNFGDANEVYIEEDADKNLFIHADTRITLDSDIGIGTTNPSAKLDVNGSVRLGSGSSTWNRIICGQVYYDTSSKKWKHRGNASEVKRVGYGNF